MVAFPLFLCASGTIFRFKPVLRPNLWSRFGGRMRLRPNTATAFQPAT